jgi:hypothetical protein
VSEYDDICNDVASSLEGDFARLEKENEQLREALKKCDPFKWIESEQMGKCVFCNEYWERDHAPDCEYMRLINGEVE